MEYSEYYEARGERQSPSERILRTAFGCISIIGAPDGPPVTGGTSQPGDWAYVALRGRVSQGGNNIRKVETSTIAIAPP